jgi:hypothetical protein
MDAGLTIKPVAGVTVTDFARPAPVYLQAGTPTDLPPAKAVNPAAAAAAVRPESSNDDYTTHNVTIDPQIREVIYRVIDTRTRQVVRQVPDEVLLRRRRSRTAYPRSPRRLRLISKPDRPVSQPIPDTGLRGGKLRAVQRCRLSLKCNSV